jgi:hypothetical protein
MAGMDQRERIIALMAIGLVAGSLFAGVVGTLRRGRSYGVMCGLLTAAFMAAVLFPLFLFFANGIRRLS